MVTVVLLRPLHMLVTEPVVGVYGLCNAFTIATLYGFFATYPIVFQEVYGFNPWQSEYAEG